MADIKQYHQSQLHSYIKCGKLYAFRYIEGIVVPPRAALTVGSAVDTGVTANFAQKVETGSDLALNDVLDIFSTDFESRATETDWADDDKGAQKDIGARLLEVHHTKLAPSIQPATVQEKFVIETDAGFNIGGTIDYTDKAGWIADTKTSKNKYSFDAVSKAIQPTLYDFAYEALRGEKAKGFRYDVLIKPTKTKPPEVQQVAAEVTETDREWLFDTITNVHKAIEAGIELPAPEGSWYCSPDWCGYWSRCKGKK